MAGDVFPSYSKTSIAIIIPTNTIGCLIDSASIAGTNYVYTVNGQMFTNATDGHIQTTAQGFSGTSDRSTPWKTLTELLAAYQHGCPEKQMRSLYTTASQDFLERVYKNPDITARFVNYASSITNMQVCMGYDFKSGYLAYVKIDHGYHSQIDPFFMIQSNGKYLLSTYSSNETNSRNIFIFLSKSAVTNQVR